MHNDIRGLPVTAASANAVQAFDHTVDAYLSYRSDVMPRLEMLFAADPECGMAHVLKGYLMMLGYNSHLVPIARAAAETAGPLLHLATPREQAHLLALTEWADGNPDKASSIWEEILRDHPHDILAFRLHHFVNFWFGRPDVMLSSVLSVEQHWSDAMPGFNSILGCRCFANEESGHYTEALPHWMMALAATGREEAARRMLEAMRDYAQGPGINARLVADIAIPVSQAILAHGMGQYEQTVALMRPVLGEMYRLGGSHAQQDVLEQVFLDAALKAGLDDDRLLMIERVSGRHPVPPARRRGYAMAA